MSLNWKKGLFLVAMAASAVAGAQGVEGPGVPGPGMPAVGIPGVGDPRLASKAYFDCAPGVGYMIFRVVDPSGYQHRETAFIGSREKCLKQAKELWKTRGTITEASTVALCVTSGGPWFLRRRVVYPVGVNGWGYLTAGVVQKLPDQEYKYEECLEYATELNGTAVQLPPRG